MKIKSRKQKIDEYNIKYPNRYYDPEISLRNYFLSRRWNFDKALKKAKKKADNIEINRKYESIRVVMYEQPVKTDRPRAFNSHIYSPNAAANHSYFEKAVKGICKDIKLINTPAEIIINAYIEMPSRVPPDEVILFEGKALDIIDMPDYDNIGKAYTDMLKNVLIIDDDIFHRGEINKFYSVVPRVEIIIRYQKSHDSDYVFKKIKSRKSVKAAIESGQLELMRI